MALGYFRKAASVQPDDVGAHINVGRTHNNMAQYDKAEKAYLLAKSMMSWFSFRWHLVRIPKKTLQMLSMAKLNSIGFKSNL